MVVGRAKKKAGRTSPVAGARSRQRTLAAGVASRQRSVAAGAPSRPRVVVAGAPSRPKVVAAAAPSRPKVAAAAVGDTALGSQASVALFDDFLPHLIARLAYLLNNDLIEKLRREDINVARWRILAVLAMGDGITISEIIDRAMMQQSALSRVLMTMEEEEYVRRVPRKEDARCVEVFLTERGRALFDSLDPVVRRRQGRLLKDFTPQEIDAAFALLRRLIHNLSE